MKIIGWYRLGALAAAVCASFTACGLSPLSSLGLGARMQRQLLVFDQTRAGFLSCLQSSGSSCPEAPRTARAASMKAGHSPLSTGVADSVRDTLRNIPAARDAADVLSHPVQQEIRLDPTSAQPFSASNVDFVAGGADLVRVVQFYIDDSHTPIEDTSVPWKPADSALVKLARVRIPSRDLDTPEARALTKRMDQLSLSPRHAMEDHRPLGNVMRARKIVYLASSALRGAQPEPNIWPRAGLGV
jgi:hypothetical protein